MTLRMPAFHRGAFGQPDAVLACQARVVHLLNARRPTHIVGLVVAIVVDAIKRSAVRTRTYVSRKISKAVSPTIADANTPRTVVLERVVIRIVATLHHHAPHRVQPCATLPVRALLRLASTRRRLSSAQVADKNLPLRPTATAAEEMSQSVAPITFADHRPVSDSRARFDVAEKAKGVTRSHRRQL